MTVKLWDSSGVAPPFYFLPKAPCFQSKVKGALDAISTWHQWYA